MEQAALVVAHQPYHSEPLRPSVSGLSNLGVLKKKIDLRQLYNELTGHSAGGTAVRSRGRRGVLVPCPFHDDTNPSMAIFYDQDDQFYHCYTCKESGDCVAMVMGLRETDFLGAVEYLGIRGELHYNEADNPSIDAPKRRSMKRVDRTYDFIYVDEDGVPLYKELRLEGLLTDGTEGKTTAYRHPDPHTSSCTCCRRFFPDEPERWNFHPRGWGFGMDGCRNVPFDLPELRARAAAGGDACLVEGANKCRLLRYAGIFATSNVGGSGFTYPDEWQEHFEGLRRAFVFTDCDRAGRIAALDRTAFLRRCGVDALFVDPDPRRLEGGYGVDDVVREQGYDRERSRAALQEIVQQSRAIEPVQIILTERTDVVDTPTHRYFSLSREGLKDSRALPSSAVYVERREGDESIRNTRFYEDIESAYARRGLSVQWLAQPHGFEAFGGPR